MPTIPPPRRLACARCGSEFGCNAGGTPGACWCSKEDFRLPQPLPAEFAAYQDCLCPDCLRAVATDLKARGFGPEAGRAP